MVFKLYGIYGVYGYHKDVLRNAWAQVVLENEILDLPRVLFPQIECAWECAFQAKLLGFP